MSNVGPSTPRALSQQLPDVSLSSHNTPTGWGTGTVAAMNETAVTQNSELPVSRSGVQSPRSSLLFRSTTIAPSPPPPLQSTALENKALPLLDTASRLNPFDIHTSSPSPGSAGLRIQTDIIPGYTVTSTGNTTTAARNSTESTRTPSKQARTIPLARTPSVKNVLASSVGSNSGFGSTPNSTLSSPMLNAMADITPLPSPLLTGDSPGPWRKLAARPQSRDLVVPTTAESALVTANGESLSAAIAHQSKRRAYHGLITNVSESDEIHEAEGHTRNRSISEYIPDPIQAQRAQRARKITVSGGHPPLVEHESDAAMRREPNLAVQRGLAPVDRPPTPPSSRAGGESDSDSSSSFSAITRPTRSGPEYFDAHTRGHSKLRRWRAVKDLGQGTFSRVVLATSQVMDCTTVDDVFASHMEGVLPPRQENLDPRKLVAIKVCEQGPKGGATGERIEMSLKRELEIMKTIHHPSLVHLKAWNIEQTRAILVLTYCPGGDLFDLASSHGECLVPGLLRRIFAELVAAVQYLHERHIVHRDLKLENVLVNLTPNELMVEQDWTKYPYSIITLTDLGLSRRVADDEKLTTRCGSDDYAAPEVIMGQSYDGRATDAWSLGVLLYALLESRLPFDHPLGRGKTSHRIARVEWCWHEYAGSDGDHDANVEKFKSRGLEGAMIAVENLLKRARSRWTMDKIAELEWVKGGVDVEDGIKFREEDIAEEVTSDSGIDISSPL